MRTCVTFSAILILSFGASTHAQSVASRAPVVPTQYVTASSPMTDGRVITTYRPVPNGEAVTNLTSVAASPPVVVTQPATTTTFAQPITTTYSSGAVTSTPYYAPIQSAAINSVRTFQPIVSAPVVSSPFPGACSAAVPTVGLAPTTVAYPMAGSPIAAGPVGFTPQYTFRPLLPIQNLPAGTYIGQGLIGQPKAYVDGQPVRNFLRYLLP